MIPYARHVWVLLWKDLLSELRTKEVLNFSLVFSLLVLVVFNFAFDLRASDPEALAPGVLWVTLVFAGTLAVGRSFVREKDLNTLEGLLLAPVDRSAIYLAKVLGNILYMGMVEMVVLPVFAALFNLHSVAPALALIVLLGTVGFAGVGTLFAAIAVRTRAREVMLPVLMFPVVVPVIIATVKTTGSVISDVGLDLPWLNLLVAFDVIFLAVSFIVFEYVIED